MHKTQNTFLLFTFYIYFFPNIQNAYMGFFILCPMYVCMYYAFGISKKKTTYGRVSAWQVDAFDARMHSTYMGQELFFLM